MSQENVEIVGRGLETLREALERRDFDSVFDAAFSKKKVKKLDSRRRLPDEQYRERDGAPEYVPPRSEDFDHLRSISSG